MYILPAELDLHTNTNLELEISKHLEDLRSPSRDQASHFGDAQRLLDGNQNSTGVFLLHTLTLEQLERKFQFLSSFLRLACPVIHKASGGSD